MPREIGVSLLHPHGEVLRDRGQFFPPLRHPQQLVLGLQLPQAGWVQHRGLDIEAIAAIAGAHEGAQGGGAGSVAVLLDLVLVHDAHFEEHTGAQRFIHPRCPCET